MNKLQLYRLLRRHKRLSTKRSPMFEQSVVAKVMLALGGALFVIYLIMYGCMMGLAVERGEYGTLMVFMPFVLVVDFLLRFMVQQTPLMQVKPYVLLPVSRYATIDIFLFSTLENTYNYLWLAMFLPYSVIALASGCSWGGTILTLITALLLMLLNSQVYLMLRTLIGRSLLWWAAALPTYALLFLPWIVNPTEKGFDHMADLYLNAGGTWWLLIAVAAALAAMLWVNRHMQYAFVYEEMSRQQKTTKLRSVSQFSFLNRFGLVGEYLKLEIKSVMRNKVMRSRFWMSLILIVIFSLMVAYTPIYDGAGWANFWCLYCFALYGITSLTKVMGPEGNYIDLLMTKHESIFQLLMAKYVFHCAVLLVPLLIMVPAMLQGKFSPLMVVAYLLLTSGLVYFIMFQLAVYNKQTLPLQQKLTGKSNIENGVQLVIELAALIVPIAVVALLQMVLGQTWGYVVQAILGLVLTATCPLWLHSVYRRTMKRKYDNLEGFHASR